MLDTSVLVAGLITNHEHHELARPHVAAARDARLAGIVLAETFARLRGYPFNLDVATATSLLEPWSASDRLLATPVGAYLQAFDDARSLYLGGNIHDLLIALTYKHHGLAVVTLDRRQAKLARHSATEVKLLAG
jgi:predicted nucleic acid-binding protein